MRIAELAAYIVNLPLRKEIKHATATRRESANVLVQCRLADGTEGWGEGVPRPYVTGETPEGTVEQFAATELGRHLADDCQTWADVIAMCERFEPAKINCDGRGYGNALRCAVELSVLDAFGRLLGEPVSAVVGHFEPARNVTTTNETVRYSGAVMAVGARKERIGALKMRAYGFRHCKIKVGMRGVDDAARLRRIRAWAGSRMDLRLDANEAWRPDEVVSKVEPLTRYNVSCLEQPVPHAQVDALAEVRRKLPLPVMLDESLTTIGDAESAIAHSTCDVFNIRLSKCGGFLRSLRLASMADAAGLSYQLGCHPGESGILSAAGRHWASSVRSIRYLEGSYDRHLLRRLLTNEDMTFGYGGKATALTGPGLGVTVNQAAMAAMSSLEHVSRVG